MCQTHILHIFLLQMLIFKFDIYSLDWSIVFFCQNLQAKYQIFIVCNHQLHS